MSDVTFLGRTTFRRQHIRFGIKQADRLSHLYLIGQTGVGKSTLIRNLAIQDYDRGRGFALIDPHGDMAEALRRDMGGRREIVYLDATARDQPYGYNPLRRVPYERIPLAAAGLLETLRKLWPLAWGTRMEHVLRNSVYALLEHDGSSLPDILRLFRDKAFRQAITLRLRNPVVRQFWRGEFEKYPPRLQAEAVAPVQNKLGALLADPRLYRLLVEPPVDLHFRRIMDKGQVLLVNLSRGVVGEESANVLGSLLVSTIGLAAFTRADTAERRPFFLYVDEFQNFTTLSIANMLSELRKFGLGLTLAHQFLGQLQPEVRQAVFGNAGTMLSFRVAPEDAISLAPEFAPRLGVEDLVNLPNRRFYVRLMIDGAPSVPFSAML